MLASDQLCLILHQATPRHKQGKKERETVTNIIASASEADLDELFIVYKMCRSQEPWMQKLIKSEKRFKTRQSLLNKFRIACIEAFANVDTWCDLYLATIWSKQTKISLQLCTDEKRKVIWVLENQGSTCLTLLQPSSSSCGFLRLPLTLTQSGEIGDGMDRMVRQCVRASRYTMGLDGATGKVKRSSQQATAKEKVTQPAQKKIITISQDYVMNPATGRKVKIGSKTHKALIDGGMIN